MKIKQTQTGIEILAPAKVNLFLEILGKRQDGFHEIDTLLCPISLFDRVRLKLNDKPGIELELLLPEERESGDPAWQIPANTSNLVVRAIQQVQAELGTSRGCSISLEKHIPAAAGLGGGSSDAAAAITAYLIALDGWNRPLATRVCAALGSDIPFFLGDRCGLGLAHATGRGEQCSFIPAQPSLEFFVTHPPSGCATKDVYGKFEKLGNIRTSRKIIAACEAGQSQKIGAELFNALQFPAAGLNDWIERQLGLFSLCDIPFALMSGSGSSCFALVNGLTSTTEILERIRSEASRIGLRRVYQTHAWYSSSIEEQI